MNTCACQEGEKPTYGELIDLLEEATSSDDLCSKFHDRYPHIEVNRRFNDAVCRIAAPTKPSLTGKCSLTRSQLVTYRKRSWEPRMRNNYDGEILFPDKLREYGLNEEILTTLFNHVRHGHGETELPWQWSLNCADLKSTSEFYRTLHQFLKKWPISRVASKSDIGRFYMAIDNRLSCEGDRPDNIYRFIDNTSKHQGDMPVSSYFAMQKNANDVETLTFEISALKKELQESKKQLSSAQSTLKDVTNQTHVLKRQRDCARKKNNHYKSIKESLIEDLAVFQEEYCDLSKEMAAVERELLSATGKGTECSPDKDFTIQTKCGRRYSPAIRKLYYTLLANEVPSSKIDSVIKIVVGSLNPSIDVEQLKLPKKACASYMRKDELKTVSAAHKATVLCQHAANKIGFKLNTDGTTKELKKIGGVGINDMVISVNELPDGTADTAIADISRELGMLRKVAHELRIPNADSINWTLFEATSSDSAATQKKLNRLIEDCRLSDKEVFGSANSATIDIVESFCSMHLAVNLRKAFLSGIHVESASSSNRYHPLDTFVHEFCKLFGRHGVPEYGCGVSFTDFLSVKSTDTDLDEDHLDYYRCCSEVTLKRQVGSRYFVSAANAMRIVFLREAAIEFLKYTGREGGTKLEKEVYQKLLDENQISFIKVDALMFYHVYADLVTLSKSNELGKSVLDMNHHYLELRLFLEEVEQHPDTVLRMDVTVFKSEARLYDSTNSKTNHRSHRKSNKMHMKLFKECNSALFPLLVSGTIKMKEKLSIYAQSNLPGGIYWEPSDPEIKKIMSEMKPSNDFCESILGLNDYLTTALPNLHQVARSNLIEVKKNKSLKWLDELPDDQQLTIIDLAVKRREAVNLEIRQMSECIASQKKERMIQSHKRREVLRRKIELERDELSQIHLITSSEELHEAITEIENGTTTATKKKKELRTILNNQVKIRKKLLGQDIQIKFSHSGRQRPHSEIIQELSDYIDEHSHELSPFVADPSTLVGQHISHKFEIEETNEVKWYTGLVLDYDSHTKTHKILYDGEDDHCFFDLTMDLVIGDLEIINH